VPALLAAEGLGVAYGSSVALADVDLGVPEGSVVGVLGPNGAGKTTMLRAIAGLVAPSAGTVFHRGVRIDGMRASEIARRGICLIPEGRGILPALTVADNLKVTLGGDRAAQERVFERFPVLSDRLQQAAGTLSGGEQQMLALARALRDGTELLLVDEPSLGLAPRLVSVISDTLRELHSDHGRTIVWVEQYAARVLELADIVYILGRGRVQWAGEPSELRSSPVLVRSYLGGSVV
jgi:branched-chain amino acid transport system ATP-binding protein